MALARRIRHVPLVSRRLRQACRDPSLWHELRVPQHWLSTEARWQSFLQWLAWRAAGLRNLTFSRKQVRASCPASSYNPVGFRN